jgi:hypothetical protein
MTREKPVPPMLFPIKEEAGLPLLIAAVLGLMSYNLSHMNNIM